MRNVYLVGMMGSGKTTSGRELARLLSISFTDLDDLIVDRAGRSINEIFHSEGEPYFRKLERDLLGQVTSQSNQVVATGGGVVLDPLNRERLKTSGVVIYLKTGLQVLWERVQEKKDRPLLATSDPQGALAVLFRERSPLYEEVSDKTFLTDKKSSEEVAREIFKNCFENR